MGILWQVSLIFVISLVCEGLASLLPVPLPGSVLAMGVLFLLFALKRLKPEDIETTSGFFLGNMTLVFVPSFVSIINYLDVLKSIAVQFVVIILVSTAVTFLVGGAVVTAVMRLQQRLSRREGKGE